MDDIINEIIIESPEKSNPFFDFTEESIQLVYIED